MYRITNREQLKAAYLLLDYYEKKLDRSKLSDADLLDEHIKEVKREVRRYVHKPTSEDTVVKDYGIDGAMFLIPCPNWVKDKNDAEYWFMGEEFIPEPRSMYDCTGKPFTVFHKPVCRHGKWYMYHQIQFDV